MLDWVNTSRFRDQLKPFDWRPMTVDVADMIWKAIDKLMQPGPMGRDSVLIPLPLVEEKPGGAPLSFYVSVHRARLGLDPRETYVWVNQFRMSTDCSLRQCSRIQPIRTPDHIVAHYPRVTIKWSNDSYEQLDVVFFGTLRDVWWRVCNRIRQGKRQVLTAVGSKGSISDTLWFDGARVVLRAGIMQAQSKLTSVLFPVKDDGSSFVAFTRTGKKTVNTVQLSIDFGGGLRITQGEWTMPLKKAFPDWSFPCVCLTERELFDLVQLPVRTYFQQKIRTDFILPCLRTLALAFHSKSIANGCRLGTVSRDVMTRIVAFLKLGFQ